MLYVDNVLVYVSGMKIAGGEYLIVVSYNSQPEALLRYKERWQVETLFKALKTNGFQVEDTHVSDYNALTNWWLALQSPSHGLIKQVSMHTSI